MFSRVLVWRYALVLAVLVSPYMGLLEPHHKTIEATSGWSSPAPLFFDTAKPRTIAQTSGTFFTPAVTSFAACKSVFAVMCVIGVSTLFVPLYSLSELQRWQL